MLTPTCWKTVLPLYAWAYEYGSLKTKSSYVPDACKTQALRHVNKLLFVRNNVLQNQIVFIFLRLINKKKFNELVEKFKNWTIEAKTTKFLRRCPIN